MKRRLTSLLLVVLLVISVLPVTAFADAAENIALTSVSYHGNGSIKKSPQVSSGHPAVYPVPA